MIPRITLPRISLVILALLVAVLALIGLLGVTRGTPVSVVIAADADAQPPAVGEPHFARTMELFTGVHLEPENEVAELLDGNGTYPVLWRDLRAAQRSITVQMYYSLQSSVADTMQAILMERSRAGVRTHVLLDAFGSQDLSEEWSDSLRAAGAHVAMLRPLHWYTLHKAANRSHVRVVVVDGRIGYTGGFGLADYWLGGGRTEGEWRETNARFSGPAVHALQATFASGWAEATGVLLTGGTFFPTDVADRLRASRAAVTDSGHTADSVSAPRATALAGLLFTQPTEGSTEAERFLALTIAGARKRLWIANAYFVPDDDFRRGLEAAARRGVDVRVMTVSEQTDVKTTRYAGRARYEALLASGVRIYEYQPTMMHAKTIVADSYFGTIGSMNFDNRSLAFNNESSLVVLDSAFAAQMERTFEADLAYSKEILLPAFKERPWTERVLEAGATLLSRVL